MKISKGSTSFGQVFFDCSDIPEYIAVFYGFLYCNKATVSIGTWKFTHFMFFFSFQVK